jgi:hypothetical protein
VIEHPLRQRQAFPPYFWHGSLNGLQFGLTGQQARM